jgi:murein DD-endopeptidase MepM/ murein hydrolase activator NlpD
MKSLPTILLVLAAGVVSASARLDLAWPTPNPACLEGRPIQEFIQPTVSGDPTSGLFGCVRSNGYQFHEGLDLKPVAERRRGEPTDAIYAAADGVVRYVNLRAGDSSYGRYIVLEHPGATPAIYTLYAHLQSVAAGLRVGDEVKRGQTIAIMGHSAGGYAIPRERAHLHFEMGLMLTRDFQTWYHRQKFGSPNEHGDWNGMNLMGFDPRDFFDRWRTHEIDDAGDFLHRLPVAVKVRVAAGRTPDFAQRYPSLVHGELPPGTFVAGWEVECFWTGLPLSLRPLGAAELGTLRPGAMQIVEMNREEIVTHRAIALVRGRGTGTTPGKDLRDVLEKLFGPLY